MDGAEDSFQDNGFLTCSASPELRTRAYASGPQLHWVRALAGHAWRRQFDFQSSKEDRGRLLRHALYAKALTTAQGAILLLELGMAQQSEALTRVAYEASFMLGAITQNEAAANSIVADHHLSQRKRIDRMRKRPEFAETVNKHEAEFDRVLQAAEQALKDDDVKAKPLEQIAALAGMSCQYTTLYTLLSDSVHSTASNLDRFLVFKDGEMEGLANEPDFANVPAVATMIGELLIAVMRMTEADAPSVVFADFLAQSQRELNQISVTETPADQANLGTR